MDTEPTGADRPSPVNAVHAPKQATHKVAAISFNTLAVLGPDTKT